MKLSQNTIIHVLLGLTVLTAVALCYMLLAPHGPSSLSPLAWVVYVTAALALGLAAFVPSLLRRRRGLPSTQPMSPADIRFFILVVLVGCALVVIGGISGMMWMSPLGILFCPLAFIIRGSKSR